MWLSILLKGCCEFVYLEDIKKRKYKGFAEEKVRFCMV